MTLASILILMFLTMLTVAAGVGLACLLRIVYNNWDDMGKDW